MHDDEVKTGLVYVPLDANTPLTWRVPKPAPTPATVQHKCARCEHAFTSPVDAQRCLEAEVAAHQERCFRVGEMVRWDNPHRPAIWTEGEFLGFSRSSYTDDVLIRVTAGHFVTGSTVVLGMGQVKLRRIPRPEQKVEPKFKPGDKVRWWPNGLDEDPRKSPFVDGVMQDDVRYLQAEYVVGFNSNWVNMRVGGTYDWSVCPGTLRHRDEPHAFVRGAACGPCSLGPPEETCAICQRDPRNDVHRPDGAIRFASPIPRPEQHRRSEHTPQCTYFDSVDSPCTCSSKYDGVALDDLLAADLAMSRETLISDMPLWFRIQDGLTRTQRQAVSAWRSAELRQRIQASKDAERRRVCVDLGHGEEP